MRPLNTIQSLSRFAPAIADTWKSGATRVVSAFAEYGRQEEFDNAYHSNS